MKQVVQNFKTGELFVDEVPVPSVQPGFVLVRNHYSLISAGTERTTVSTAQSSLLGKARQRPDLVKQVLDTFQKEGLAETIKRVRSKLSVLKELGYSSAGTVMMSMDTNGRFKANDTVACGGGGYASHSGVVSVPQNLVVKVPESVPLNQGVFATLGAIAMQGLRQAGPEIGDSVCVIGLGLLGQLIAQLLRANGCQVFGIDIAERMVELSMTMGCHEAVTRADPDLRSRAEHFTRGHGFDSVVIAAATRSADPIELSTELLRQKGTIVVVGSVPMNIPREPHFYQKELNLKISCSYGPGRYDHSYEEEGHDYPYGYVRWTENRNMASFVKLLENRSVDTSPLVSHVFDIDEAQKAYEIVSGKTSEEHLGILLKFPAPDAPKPVRSPALSAGPERSLKIGFIGAGSFAQKALIEFAGSKGELRTVVTSHGVSAKSVGDKYGFKAHSTDAHEVLGDQGINLVFIATRHNTHADLTIAALEAGKNVFVEKPLCICEADLDRIAEALKRSKSSRLMVGFNRRYSPLAVQARELFGGVPEPLFMNYRISAGSVPRDHWIQTDEGGGRILGEVCHFVDLVQHIAGSEPTEVFAQSVNSENTNIVNHDNVAITLRFEDGSVGNITYVACGDRRLSKERVEVFGGGNSFVIDDFRFGESYVDGSFKKIRQPGKGHREEIEAFTESILNGLPSPLSFSSIYKTTEVTFRIIDSLSTGLPQKVPK